MQDLVKQLDSILETWGAANFITESDQNDVRHALGQLRAQLAATPAPASDEVLTDADLAIIEQVEQLAARAPWFLGDLVPHLIMLEKGTPVADFGSRSMGIEQCATNARLAVLLRNAAPALLARVRQAQAQVMRWLPEAEARDGKEYQVLIPNATRPNGWYQSRATYRTDKVVPGWYTGESDVVVHVQYALLEPALPALPTSPAVKGGQPHA